MSTNRKIIMSEIAGTSGHFHLPIDFIAFNNNQKIPDAIFDTGCSHSLISISSLNLGNKPDHKLRSELICNKNVQLIAGSGVETSTSNLQRIISLVNKVNNTKMNSKDSKAVAASLNKLSVLEKSLLLTSKNIRFMYRIKELRIDNVYMGDYDIRIAFNTEVNLIGMHIIKDLYTKIFYSDGIIKLFAVKNDISSNLNDLDDFLKGMDETMELYEDSSNQILEANYLIQRLKNNR